MWPASASVLCDVPLVGASTYRGTQINIYTTTDKKGRLIVNAKETSATVCCTFAIPKAEVATADAGDVKARVQSKLEDMYPCSAAAPEHPPHDLGSSLTLEEHRGLFSEEAADVLMAGVEALADRDCRAPQRLAPDDSLLRDKASNDGRRWRKRAAEAAPDEGKLCKKTACVAARAERDAALAKAEELQQMRRHRQLLHNDSRIPNIIFAGGSVGKAPRESRSGVQVLEDDLHNLLKGGV